MSAKYTKFVIALLNLCNQYDKRVPIEEIKALVKQWKNK